MNKALLISLIAVIAALAAVCVWLGLRSTDSNGKNALTSSGPRVDPDYPLPLVRTDEDVLRVMGAEGKDVLVIVTAPFKCPPCEAMKKAMKAEAEKVANWKNEFKGVEVVFYDNTVEGADGRQARDSLMENKRIAPLVRGFPSVLYFKGGRGNTYVDQQVQNAMGKAGAPTKVEQWEAMLKHLAARKEQFNSLKAEKAVPEKFTGFVVYVDTLKVLNQAKDLLLDMWRHPKQGVAALGHGEVILVEDGEKAGQLELFKEGEAVSKSSSFVPQKHPLEGFQRCIERTPEMMAKRAEEAKKAADAAPKKKEEAPKAEEKKEDKKSGKKGKK